MDIQRKFPSSIVNTFILNIFMSILLLIGLVAAPVTPAIAATQIDIPGPAGSGSFGYSVSVLPNGNFVVCDPDYDDGAKADVGAVYLYDGASREPISRLTGSTSGDRVCSGGVTVLTNGNYVVSSPEWQNDGTEFAGAVTWGDGSTGIDGVVSPANSLVGSTAEDRVGEWGRVTALSNGNYLVSSSDRDNGTETDAGAVTWGDGNSGTSGEVSPANSLVGSSAGDTVGWRVTALSNGNYVVRNPDWDNAGIADAGAVTWMDGSTGTSGAVSPTNSLVGSTADDRVGEDWVIPLINGNYVVSNPLWDNAGIADAGAVTWGDGSSGTSGAVSPTNSLVGSTAGDQVGYHYGVSPLINGNYVVRSPWWDKGGITDAGAVTWGDGSTGISGAVSAANSLVGSTAYDRVGEWWVKALDNGNYVVSSPDWDNGSIADAGAVTWGDGTTGITGAVSPANSLVGSSPDDRIGIRGVAALSNGNYVVPSFYWDNGTTTDAGAATWGDGTTGITGEVSQANSLVGNSGSDYVGEGVIALSNGNYVVLSYFWGYHFGAATWGDGSTGITGTVSPANSLVGSTPGDRVGEWGVTALDNGNYVVRSPSWDNGTAIDAGAVTWGDGKSGISGAVSPTNSLVGSTAGDQVGYHYGVTALSNGNYVVSSTLWDNGGTADTGAVTWGDGTTGTNGAVSPTNSLVGSTAGDLVGSMVVALSNGNYVVGSCYWDNTGIADAGAVTWGDGASGTSGPLTLENSVLGTASDGGEYMNFGYDEVNEQLVVGRPYDNIVILFRPNRTPVGDAGPNQTVMSQAAVILDGSASHDPDENLPLTFAWQQSGGTPVTLNDSDTANPTFTAPEVITQTSILTFTLVVSDSLGLTSLPDQVVISVEPYPVADAGPDQTIKSNTTVILDGSASYDPDGNLPLAFAWQQSGGTPVTLNGSDTANPTFTAPEVITQTSVLTFTLVVSDSLGLVSLPDEVVISVVPHSAFLPVILNQPLP